MVVGDDNLIEVLEKKKQEGEEMNRQVRVQSLLTWGRELSLVRFLLVQCVD